VECQQLLASFPSAKLTEVGSAASTAQDARSQQPEGPHYVGLMGVKKTTEVGLALLAARSHYICDKLARGDTGLCRGHGRQGGGRRCAFELCDKLARGSTSSCTLHAHEAHGGGAATTGVNVPNALIDARCTQMEADNKAHNAQVLAEQQESI
jgi:hypothetical protein